VRVINSQNAREEISSSPHRVPDMTAISNCFDSRIAIREIFHWDFKWHTPVIAKACRIKFDQTILEWWDFAVRIIICLAPGAHPMHYLRRISVKP
jgi:hypothetical protein